MSACDQADETTPLVAGESVKRLSSIAAREAFESSDVESSRHIHIRKSLIKREQQNDDDVKAVVSPQERASEAGHQMEGDKLKPIIFGGLDGILTSFAIVAGAAGGRLDVGVVLILGFSNIFADALAMGVGEFLSSKAEAEWILSEKKREEWEYDNYPEGEIQEMIEIYEEKGMGHEDAELVVNTMAKYRDFFIEVMMVQELELQIPAQDHVRQSAFEGLVMFCSFAFFGALPLLGYVIIPLLFPDLSTDLLFTAACIITAIVLFFMGSVKSFFSKHHWFHTGLETMLLGGACALVAYTIGQFIERLTRSSAE